jgi:hypothetical protein
MVLTEGSKVLACHRRLFDSDQPRYFVGEVVAATESVIKINGFSFVRDLGTGKYLRKEDLRTKIISLVAGSHILYELPGNVIVRSLKFTYDGYLTLADDLGFQMDLAELPHEGHI